MADKNVVELEGTLYSDWARGDRGPAKAILETRREYNGREYIDYHPLVAWGDLADRCCGEQGPRCGDRVRVTGEGRGNLYTDRNGIERAGHEVQVGKVGLLARGEARPVEAKIEPPFEPDYAADGDEIPF